jgi:hypothetical protein
MLELYELKGACTVLRGGSGGNAALLPDSAEGVMPFGLILMIGFSFLVFRRARSFGRHPGMWVLALWLLALGVGFIGTIVGVVFALLGATHELTNRELQSAVILPTGIGMVVGVAIAIWGSGRVPGRAAEPDAEADVGSDPGS